MMENNVYITAKQLAETKRRELKHLHPDLGPELIELDIRSWLRENPEDKKLEPVYDDEGTCFGYM